MRERVLANIEASKRVRLVRAARNSPALRDYINVLLNGTLERATEEEIRRWLVGAGRHPTNQL